MNHAVAFESVTFAYPEARGPVLKDVTLEVPEGSFVLVCGRTGSGKSTLIRAMNGLVPHFSGGTWSGRVTIEGRDTLEWAPRHLADVAAFVPQDPGAAFVLDKVEDELAYAMENLAVDPSLMRRRVEETLDLLDIASLRDRSVRTLSGGERQRVAIAAALTPGARLLLLDEPTSQLDPQGAEDVLAALQRLVHDLGITVVLAEHRLERVAGFADVALGCSGDGTCVLGEPSAVLERLALGPPVAHVGRLLGWQPVPLTVREARRRARSVDLRYEPASSPGPQKETSSSSRTATGAIATVRQVTAAYGSRVALRDVDIELHEAEVVAVMGRNGAGKSTLLRCLAGVHEPLRGSVRIGTEVPATGRNVALCPQRPEVILFSDTVLHEVQATVAASTGGPIATNVLEELGLSDLASQHPRDLSAGQRLLVAVAAVVATGASLLLLDEPTRGLDLEAKARLRRFLESYTARGNSAVIATHDVELVAEMASRVVILAEGEVIADGAPADILGDSPVFAPQMTRVFGAGWLTPEQVVSALVTV